MRPPAAAALAALVLLAGCGSAGKTTTVVKTVTEPAATDTTTAETTATDTTPTETTTVETTVSPPAFPGNAPPPRTLVHATTFRSPSGNIGCQMLGGEARCDIRDRSWSPPPKPASCPLDYGQGLFVRAKGRGQVVCAGDTALLPSARKLGYDTGSRVGDLECVSRTQGMSCTNRQGHGFFLSRQTYRTF